MAVITCICAGLPGTDVETRAIQSLRATAAEFPGAMKYAGVDLATPAIIEVVRTSGWKATSFWPDEWTFGKSDGLGPPQMSRLIGRCMKHLRYSAPHDPIVWTIEQDSVITPGARRIAEDMLAAYPMIGAVECLSLDPSGKMTRPCLHREEKPFPESQDKTFTEVPLVSLNCVAWRRSILDTAAWDIFPRHGQADFRVSAHARKQGWRFLMSHTATCTHHLSHSMAHLLQWVALQAQANKLSSGMLPSERPAKD